MGEHGGRDRPGLRDVGGGHLVRRREHVVGLGQRQVELARPQRGLGAPRRQLDHGRTRVDGGGVELARTGEAGAQRLVGRGHEDAGDPVADRPGAEQAPGRGEDVAAAVELPLRQRALHLDPGRGRRPLQHRRRDQRDRRAVGGEQAFRAGRLHQLVEGGGVGGDVGAQQRDEQVGLHRGAQRPGPQELAHPGGKAVDGVAQLGQEAAGRAGRVPPPAGRVGARLLDERGEQAVDQRGVAAGLGEHEVDDGIRGPRGPFAEQVHGPGLHTRPIERPEDDRRPVRRERHPERGHAVGSGPGPVGDDEHAARCGRQRGEPGQLGGGEPVRVVDEQRHIRPRLGVGALAQHGEPARGEDLRQRVQQHGLAGARGTDDVDAAQPLGLRERLPQQSARRGRPASGASEAAGACTVITNLP